MEKKKINKNLLTIIFLDLLIFWGSIYVSYLLRFDFSIPKPFLISLIKVLPYILVAKLVIFYFFDLYRGMWRYTSIVDLMNILKATTLSSMFIMSGLLMMTRFKGFPRSAYLIDWFLTILLVAGLRMTVRFCFQFSEQRVGFGFIADAVSNLIRKEKRKAKNLIIIGAGSCGEIILREMINNSVLNYRVLGFLDDNPAKHGKKIHGIRVLGAVEQIDQFVRAYSADEILIAIPSASAKQMRRIVRLCKKTEITYKTLPNYGELINGSITVHSIREVAYQDLIGREVVKLDEISIKKGIAGRVILVTGAAGSIGSELCRQLCRYDPEKIVLFDRAESPLYNLELELSKTFPTVVLHPILGDILNTGQLDRAFSDHEPKLVFHAAAYKHVPVLELQPWNAVGNNILGTMNVVNSAKANGVERFVFVSTDKAVRPTNVMGATKRVSEMLVQCQKAEKNNTTLFMTVRFGNVVGSVGSVVPLFRKQIANGGPVTVTHPEVTRFFMTIPEASQLILEASTMGNGGEIFILDMGTSIKIDDMAKDLIRLSGFEPDVDISIEYTGLRPGEKLHEELIDKDEGLLPTTHEKILVLESRSCDLNWLTEKIDRLADLAVKQDVSGIKTTLKQIVSEYTISSEKLKHDSTSDSLKILTFPGAKIGK